MPYSPLAWIGRLPITDPLERRTAVTMQVFCIGLTALLVVTEVGRAVRAGMPADAIGLYGVFADCASIVASVAAVVQIRRGRVRQGFVTAIGSYVAVLAGSLAFRGLAYHQHILVRVYWVLLVLPALLLGRRALWGSLGAVLTAMLIGHLRDIGRLGGSGPHPPSEQTFGAWGQAVAVMLLLSIVLDRFGTALREAYAAARIKQLDAEKASAELGVANRSLAEEMERRARAEAMLLQSQKLEAIGRLSAGVAHDFNNVLTAILGFAELARIDCDPGDPRRDDIGQIIEAARRAGGLTRQLLAFARRQIVEPRVVAIEDRIGELMPMLRRLIGDNIEVVQRFDTRSWKVLVDRVQLDQVLLNLAVNARDAMPNGGTLTFGTDRATFDTVDSDATPELEPGEYVRLMVSDTGTGMSKTTLESVFEPFFTTKERGKGTGLGLSTCYGIVRQAKGVITASSLLGQGTTFEILLPRATEGAAEMNSPPVSSGAELRKGRGQTVLVVDDEPHVVAIAARVLRAEGYRVLTAGEPAEAADVAAAHSGDIAAVLTDVVMPGKNGRTFVEDLKRARPSIAVVYMSGYSDDVVARHGVLQPNIHLLCKPFTPDALVRKVAEALDSGVACASRASSKGG